MEGTSWGVGAGGGFDGTLDVGEKPAGVVGVGEGVVVAAEARYLGADVGVVDGGVVGKGKVCGTAVGIGMIGEGEAVFEGFGCEVATRVVGPGCCASLGGDGEEAVHGVVGIGVGEVGTGMGMKAGMVVIGIGVGDAGGFGGGR